MSLLLHNRHIELHMGITHHLLAHEDSPAIKYERLYILLPDWCVQRLARMKAVT